MSQQKGTNGFGMASLVLGIIALLLSCLVFGGVIGIIALVLGIIGITKKGRTHGTSIAGIILGSISILIMIIILLVASGTDASKKASDDIVPAMEVTETISESQSAVEETPVVEEVSSTPDEVVSEVQDTAASDETMGQKNALAKAKDYLSFSAFSYTGLISQLEYEGFTTEEATYGTDNCEADWNEQAALKAENYLELSSFSKEGLIEQLEYEGFTNEQAQYGATEVGY